MIDKSGWLNNSNYLKNKSPFFNKRPENTKISLIVIHCISLPEGEYCDKNCGIDRLFTNQLDRSLDAKYYQDLKDLKVSAHCVIFRNGSIKQYVSFLDRAWHAGESIFKGVTDCNNFSIGIELEGSVKDKSGYTDFQYRSLNKLINILREYFNMSENIKDCVTTHQEIAPSRKDDPGPYFDFNRIC